MVLQEVRDTEPRFIWMMDRWVWRAGGLLGVGYIAGVPGSQFAWLGYKPHPVQRKALGTWGAKNFLVGGSRPSLGNWAWHVGQ